MKFIAIAFALACAAILALYVYADTRHNLQPDAFDHMISNTCNADRTRQTFVWEAVNGYVHTEHLKGCVIEEKQ